jgi:phospholipid-binding lipoprotein MlaA
MKEPRLFFNNVLKGRFERAGITLGRFTANTSLGLAGIFDVAAMWGLKRQSADFGQTLFVWGFPEGPYLILPLLGPSNPRDAIGMGIDSYADPFTILATTHGIEEWKNALVIRCCRSGAICDQPGPMAMRVISGRSKVRAIVGARRL